MVQQEAKDAPRAAPQRIAKQKTTRARAVASKEAAIVGAARAAFNAEGFEGATIAQIARAAGVADGTLYLYFENKEALARAALAAFYSELTDTARIGVKRAKDCRGKLKFLARHHINNVMAERRLMELIFTLEPDMDSYGGTQVYQLNKAYVEVFDEVIREASWRGEISDATPAWLLRDIFYGGLIYALRSILLDGRKRSVDVAVDGIVNLIAPAGEPSDEKSLHDVADRLSRIADRLEEI